MQVTSRIYKKVVKMRLSATGNKWKQDKERKSPQRGGSQASKVQVTKLSFDIYSISNSLLSLL